MMIELIESQRVALTLGVLRCDGVPISIAVMVIRHLRRHKVYKVKSACDGTQMLLAELDRRVMLGWTRKQLRLIDLGSGMVLAQRLITRNGLSLSPRAVRPRRRCWPGCEALTQISSLESFRVSVLI